jgi:hypothetical protein
VGCCKPERWCARFVAKLLDEEWTKGTFVAESVELVWIDAAGAIVAAPVAADGTPIAAAWFETSTSTLTRDFTHPGRVMAPPEGHELVFVGAAGGDERIELSDAARPAWRDVKSQVVVELSAATRSRIEWRNSKTGEISRADPNAASPLLLLEDAGALERELEAEVAAEDLDREGGAEEGAALGAPAPFAGDDEGGAARGEAAAPLRLSPLHRIAPLRVGPDTALRPARIGGAPSSSVQMTAVQRTTVNPWAAFSGAIDLIESNDSSSADDEEERALPTHRGIRIKAMQNLI